MFMVLSCANVRYFSYKTTIFIKHTTVAQSIDINEVSQIPLTKLRTKFNHSFQRVSHIYSLPWHY